MKLRKSALLSLVAIALLALTVGVTAAQGTTVEVTMTTTEFKFDPSELNVTAGAEVTFNVTNSGQFPHNVTFVAPDGTETKLFEANVAPGTSATGKFTFSTAGDWKMYCPVGQHEAQGMVGTVHVAAAATASGGAATTASTPTSLPTTGGNALPYLAAGALVLIGAGLWLRRTAAVRA